MKAILWTAYGPPDVLKPGEVEMVIPRDNEVLIRVHAATVSAGDVEARGMQFPLLLAAAMRIFAGLTRPKRIRVLGQELSGEVVGAGSRVTRFKPGDRVYGTTGFGFGAYAEYICLPEASEDSVLAIIPDELDYIQAATLPTGGLEALHFLRQGELKPGDQVLVNGAGGSIGSFAVQLAKLSGADVTGVDRADKLDRVLSLGADHVINYAVVDFSKQEQKYDVVLDVVGKRSFGRSVRALKPNGRYLLANPRLSSSLRGAWVGLTSGKKVLSKVAGRSPEDLDYLGNLCASGKIKPVIDKIFPFEQTAEAHRYVETGQKQGNVVILVES
ncbi:MAG: NAD(P)-dependent alcohol dehydrogenase [Chloroflexota bacterium]|nr:NAD(P)-dependent alcohol dehydrogenase [Chloroflexota bacterium]